jgi:DNA-binding NarL/FixJ family response regulator
MTTKPFGRVCGLSLLETQNGRFPVKPQMANTLLESWKLVPDVVILDLSLPGRNGFEVAKEIRRIAPSTKIVFFSMHEIPATTQIVGADAFVAKSSSNASLLATLERVLQLQQAPGHNRHLS